MTTIFERVETALTALNPAVPHALDTYLTAGGGDLPDTYIQYSVFDSDAEAHADDVETHRSYYIQISIFARGGLVTLPNVDAAMKAQGFVKSSGRQLQRDPQTGHFGWAQDFIYLERIQ